MRWKQIKAEVSRRQLRRSVAAGELLRLSGSYALPAASTANVLARQMRGIASHRTAAAHWGLALPPGLEVGHVTVPHKAHRTPVEGIVLHYRNLNPIDVDGQVTTLQRTVIDCLRDLALRDALAVGDSALRAGLVDRRELAARACALQGPGSRRTRDRVELLDARAVNAFESTCRAILIEGGVTGFTPQLCIRHRGQFLARVDLGNQVLRIVVECESFAYHGERSALRRDCRRYTNLEAAGWRVLRVMWEDVMYEPDWVLARVRETVALASGPSSAA